MKDFLRVGPPFPFLSGADRALHRLHDGPPLVFPDLFRFLDPRRVVVRIDAADEDPAPAAEPAAELELRR